MSSRVVLVRSTHSAAPAAGGCCGGDVPLFDDGGGHCHAPPADDIGEAYRALRAALPADVDIQIVSPSNWVWLLPELVRGGRRRGLRGADLRRSVRAGMAISSVLVDGVAVVSGGLPGPAEIVSLVGRELERHRAPGPVPPWSRHAGTVPGGHGDAISS